MSRIFFLTLTLATLITAPAALVADAIPYPNVGTVPPTPTLTGLSKLTPPLEVDLTFVSAGSTNGIDTIRIYDVTHDYFSLYFFNSETTRPGTTEVFLATTQDVFVIFIHNSVTGLDLSSDPAYSPDGITHAYVTKLLIGGLYVGMEDSPAPVRPGL